MDTRSSNVPRDPFHSIRTILYITACILAAIGFLILLRSVGNAAFLKGYEKGNYSEMPEALLTPLRFGDNYVIPYNLGNAAYHKGDYDRAVSCLQTALDSNPPEYDEECRIRVNLALSLCRTINFEDLDRSDDEAVSKAVQTLYTARSVLTVHECASEPVGSNDGHFENADKLKHDIDRMLEDLQNQLDENNNEDNSNSNQENNQNDNQNNQNDDQNDDQNGSGNTNPPPGSLPGAGAPSDLPGGDQAGGGSGSGDNSDQDKSGDGGGNQAGDDQSGGGSGSGDNSGGGNSGDDQSGGGGGSGKDNSGGGRNSGNNSGGSSGHRGPESLTPEQRKAERERQKKLKQDLEEQKEGLENGSTSGSSSDYEYLDPGDTRGFGDRTLW